MGEQIQPVPPQQHDRFRREYRALTEDEVARMNAVKHEASVLEGMIDQQVPNGREKSLAFTHLEDCVLRAVRGITE